MKVTCGTDIIEINRIKESIETMEDKFLNRVFTPNEIEYCNSKRNQKYQHYAARFAAKEAIFKAVSVYLNDKYSIGWKDVEIINDEQGRPQAKFFIEIDQVEQVDVSLSHCKEYATANVVVIGKRIP